MGAVAPSWSSSASVALNLNIHLHALVLDGVFTSDDGAVRFHAVPQLTREEVAQVVALIARRITRLLERHGLSGRAEDGETSNPWSEEAPLLAAVAAASVDGRVAMGPRAGGRVRPPVRRPTYAGALSRARRRVRSARWTRRSSRPPRSVGAGVPLRAAPAPGPGAAPPDP
jgi:hypothetical protein